MATTYYYPSNFGAAEFVQSGSSAGTASFVSNFQSPANSYTIITAVNNTSPQEYIITTGYTGQGTGTTFTAFQTPYSNTDHNETYAPSIPLPGGGTAPAYLILTNGAVPSDYSYTFSGQSSAFNPTGGSTSDPTVCFATGTRIRTLSGDVYVEDLRIGDLVVTSSGLPSPVVWLGHRTIDCRNHPRRAEVLPIRVTSHAFGESLPLRHLFVSPGHSICVDACGEVLIPAGSLVNGTTIVQVDVEMVTYWHVELDKHEIILAEGLPCESYLEMGNRNFFAENGTVALGGKPDAAVRTHTDFCRPYYADGPLVDAVRARLLARADAVLSEPIKRAA